MNDPILCLMQTTIGVIDTRFDYQVTIYLELMMIYLGGTFYKLKKLINNSGAKHKEKS